MAAATWRGRATERTVGVVLPLAVVAAMVVVDVVIGGTFPAPLPAIVLTDAAVGVTVAFALRYALVAGVVASSVSLAASAVVRELSWTTQYGPEGANYWFGFGELVALAYVTAVAVRVLPPIEAAVVAAGFGAALVALVEVRHAGTLAHVLVVPLGAGFAATVAVGLYLRSVDRGRELADQRVRQEERTEIARELHDLVAHHVTGIVLQAQAARLVSADQPEVADRALAAIEGAGSEALRSMRAMVGSLRADLSAPVAPTATLDDLRTIATSQPGEVPVRVVIDDGVERVPSAVVASVYRIAREALTNARRHARGASHIDVRVWCQGADVGISVANDGQVVTSRSSQGFGLVGIAERVDALGGRFSAGPQERGGWVVTAVLPVTGR